MQKLILCFLLGVFTVSGTVAQDLRGDTIDIRSTFIKLNVTDYTGKTISGDATIGIKAKKDGINNIHIDLLGLTVDSVKVNAAATAFSHNDTVITIAFPSSINTGDSAALEIFYHGHPVQPAGDFGGFYFNGTYAFNIGVSFLDSQHCYGRVWFPCFDNFTERCHFEYIITTKSNYKAFCNGTLLDSSTSGVTSTWHWKLAEEIPSYLASVSVADYQTLLDTVQGMNGTLPVMLAARSFDTTALKKAFVHLHNAFHIQEAHWGAYRWERVGYCIVPFTSGVMEHATNISFMQSYLNNNLASAEVTMAHELSHHWFGDLVTCNNASEMWLNEGWATYNEKLFTQQFYGDSAYRRIMLDNHEYVLHYAHQRDGAYLPVSGVPTQATYGTTVYRKGGDMVHTLRYYMGDTLFFHCVKNYLTDNAFHDATTAKLRDYLSQCSGINLSDFFNDWIYAPGFPHFSIERKSISPVTGGGFRTEMVIRQRLSHAPHFYNNVPVVVSYFDVVGKRTDRTVEVSGECTSYSFVSENEPVYIAIDFDGSLQDAITDEYKWLTGTGLFNFGTAKLILTVNSATDSNLVRVEHNWIRPEPMHNKIPGLHLHDMRYWMVDGLFREGFDANARIDYTGSDASLDASFITNSEDSMVVMYRASADSEWVVADSFAINNLGNPADKVGYINIYHVKKGQYCMAIWNSALPDTTTAETECVYTDIAETEANAANITLHPNPANETVTIRFSQNDFERLEVYDIMGRKIWEEKISPVQASTQLNLRNITPGCYLITLNTITGIRVTKKLIKE